MHSWKLCAPAYRSQRRSTQGKLFGVRSGSHYQSHCRMSSGLVSSHCSQTSPLLMYTPCQLRLQFRAHLLSGPASSTVSLKRLNPVSSKWEECRSTQYCSPWDHCQPNADKWFMIRRFATDALVFGKRSTVSQNRTYKSFHILINFHTLPAYISLPEDRKIIIGSEGILGTLVWYQAAKSWT